MLEPIGHLPAHIAMRIDGLLLAGSFLLVAGSGVLIVSTVLANLSLMGELYSAEVVATQLGSFGVSCAGAFQVRTGLTFRALQKRCVNL
ncbi:MAG: hypothetical protein ABI672_11910 [Vicinamibacteria bacterium]